MTLSITAPGTFAPLFTTLLPFGLTRKETVKLAADVIQDAARRMGVSYLALSFTVKAA